MKVKKIWILAAVIAVCFAFVPIFGGFVAKAETGENSGDFETVDLRESATGFLRRYAPLNDSVAEDGFETEERDTLDSSNDSLGMTEESVVSETESVISETEERDTLDSSNDSLGMTEESVVPETEGSVWFKEKILPYVMEYGAAALGVLTAVLLALKKLRVTIADLVGAYNALKKSNKDNESLSEGVNTFKADVREWQEEAIAVQREFMEKQAAETQAFMTAQKEAMEKGFLQIATSVADKLDDACATAHKILDVEELAFEENPALVSSGTSKKIAEVIHSGEETKNKR